jgi:hypothetical protein
VGGGEDENPLVRLYRRDETVVYFAGHLEMIAQVLASMLGAHQGVWSDDTGVPTAGQARRASRRL